MKGKQQTGRCNAEGMKIVLIYCITSSILHSGVKARAMMLPGLLCERGQEM